MNLLQYTQILGVHESVSTIKICLDTESSDSYLYVLGR